MTNQIRCHQTALSHLSADLTPNLASHHKIYRHSHLLLLLLYRRGRWKEEKRAGGGGGGSLVSNITWYISRFSPKKLLVSLSQAIPKRNASQCASVYLCERHPCIYRYIFIILYIYIHGWQLYIWNYIFDQVDCCVNINQVDSKYHAVILNKNNWHWNILHG